MFFCLLFSWWSNRLASTTPLSLIDDSAAGRGSSLLGALSACLNQVLQGKTPDAVCLFFWGESLVALNTTDGGPIVIVNKLRLVLSILIFLEQSMSLLLVPYKLRYSTHCGAEALVYAARVYLGSLQPGQIVAKHYFRNVFNPISVTKCLPLLIN